ncbi:MAG: DUF1016 N-terminal domain-containing protein [Bacteroidota bacterium]
MQLVNNLFQEIRELIISAKQSAAVVVNAEAVVLHWRIGSVIKREILQDQRGAYGQEVIKTLAKQLTLEFGSGFSRTNLLYFVQFATKFPDFEIVHALRGQLSWTHFRIFLTLENEPIGLILCAGKAEEQIELLMLDKGNIRVAEYLTELPPKEVLQAKLHEAVQKAKQFRLKKSDLSTH